MQSTVVINQNFKVRKDDWFIVDNSDPLKPVYAWITKIIFNGWCFADPFSIDNQKHEITLLESNFQHIILISL